MIVSYPVELELRALQVDEQYAPRTPAKRKNGRETWRRENYQALR